LVHIGEEYLSRHKTLEVQECDSLPLVVAKTEMLTGL
jgi:hypothetical protein